MRLFPVRYGHACETGLHTCCGLIQFGFFRFLDREGKEESVGFYAGIYARSPYEDEDGGNDVSNSAIKQCQLVDSEEKDKQAESDGRLG